MNNWYESKTGNGQGLVIEEDTGRNVAVTYRAEDAKFVALVPKMISVLDEALDELEYLKTCLIKSRESGNYIEVDNKIIRELLAIKSELGV